MSKNLALPGPRTLSTFPLLVPEAAKPKGSPGLGSSANTCRGARPTCHLDSGIRKLVVSWVPCKQPVLCHCKQLVSRAVVTVPESQCDCPVTRYSATGPCHLKLSKQCSENGQQHPVWSVRCSSQAGSNLTRVPTPRGPSSLALF